MRLFVAVWPSSAVVAKLSALARPSRPGIRWTTEEEWHVTLLFLGDVSEEELRGVKGALVPLSSASVDSPVPARVRPALRLLGPTVLYLPVAGLDTLAAEVAALISGYSHDAPG